MNTDPIPDPRHIKELAKSLNKKGIAINVKSILASSERGKEVTRRNKEEAICKLIQEK